MPEVLVGERYELCPYSSKENFTDDNSEYKSFQEGSSIEKHSKKLF